MAGLFSKAKTPRIYMAPPTDTGAAAKESEEAAAAAREAERVRKRKKTQTIFTGPLGLAGEPTVLKHKLGE